MLYLYVLLIMINDVIVIYCDAACWNGGNKIMGIGVYCKYKGVEIEITKNYGVGTSNIGEWIGLCEALKLACKIQNTLETNQYKNNYGFIIKSDSQIIVKQFNGIYEIKKGGFAEWNTIAKEYEKELKILKVEWIPREQNKKADILSKVALLQKEVKFNK